MTLHQHIWMQLSALGILAGTIGIHAWGAEPPTSPPIEQREPATLELKVTVAVARDRAKLMHDVHHPRGAAFWVCRDDDVTVNPT